MREVERIADQLWRSLQGPAWHGPALLELLRDVDAEEAAARPVAAAHSIWELVEHAAAWLRFVEGRLRANGYIVSAAENFPAVADVSEAAWQQSQHRLAAVTETLRDTILLLDEPWLEEMVDTAEGGEISIYGLLHGVVQHNLYHAGQVALLKRAAREQSNPV